MGARLKMVPGFAVLLVFLVSSNRDYYHCDDYYPSTACGFVLFGARCHHSGPSSEIAMTLPARKNSPWALQEIATLIADATLESGEEVERRLTSQGSRRVETFRPRPQIDGARRSLMHHALCNSILSV